MGRRKCPENRHALEFSVPVDGLEDRSESLPVTVVDGQVGDVFFMAVVAAGEAAVLIEHGRTVEPLAGGDDKVVEFVHLVRPCLVQLI